MAGDNKRKKTTFLGGDPSTTKRIEFTIPALGKKQEIKNDLGPVLELNITDRREAIAEALPNLQLGDTRAVLEELLQRLNDPFMVQAEVEPVLPVAHDVRSAFASNVQANSNPMVIDLTKIGLSHRAPMEGERTLSPAIAAKEEDPLARIRNITVEMASRLSIRPNYPSPAKQKSK